MRPMREGWRIVPAAALGLTGSLAILLMARLPW